MKLFSRGKKTKKTAPPQPYPIARPYSSPTAHRRRTPVPDKIGRFYVPLSVLEATSNFVRRFGSEQRECYVWWGGYFTCDGDAQVLTALCPDIHTEFGHIHLSTDELLSLQNRLRSLDQSLLVELHSHPPGGGGQNEVDAAHPAATYRGFISIVIPDFGAPHFYDLRHAYVYEYVERNQWRQLPPPEIESRFVIEESALVVKV